MTKLCAFIASHLTKYRMITIKQAINSIDECVEKAKSNLINVYLSYSYEEVIYNELDQLEIELRKNKNVNIIFYRHNQKKLQFEHFKYIIDINTFDEDEWVMFLDDDDICVNSRIKRFLSYQRKYNDINVFGSYIIRIERSNIIKNPYSLLNLIKIPESAKHEITDFATIFVKIKIIKEFFNIYNEPYNFYTDCFFSVFVRQKNYYLINEYLYMVRTRMFTTEEQFIDLYNLHTSTTFQQQSLICT